MKYLKEEKTTRNPLLVPVIVLSLVVVGLLGMLVLSVFGKRTESNAPIVQNAQSNKTYVVETQDGKVVDEDFLETPYCNLYYPAQWKDSMDGQVIETESGFQVVFTGKVADKKAELFVIYFGKGTENAFPIGILKTETGEEIETYAELLDFAQDDTWTQEEVDTFCAMQESVNHIIAKLEEQTQSPDK